MLRALAIFALALSFVAPALAQRAERLTEITAESYRVELDGPGENEKRNVYFWRPANAPRGPLPVVYVADGIAGLDLIGARLRPHILSGAARPVLIVATDPHPRRRRQEYVPGHGSNPDFDRHARWYTDVVLPWAERALVASRDPNQRVIAGVSNGADFAVAMASRHPELFGRVIAHSAANDPPEGFAAAAGSRWVLTAGINEGGPYPAMAARLGEAIGERPIRHCLGPWRHDARSWREISAGALAWALDLGDVAAVQTTIEAERCITADDWPTIAATRRAARR